MKSQASALLILSLLCGAASAQEMPPPDDYLDKPWTESAAPPPPEFDTDRLIPVYVGPKSSLSYGVDPKTLNITLEDRLVRYVMVGRSTSGTLNVTYDAIRCATGEYKTYARYNAGSGWTPMDNAEWRPMSGQRMGISYPLALADSGVCVGTVVNGPVSRMIESLKRGGMPEHPLR